LSLDPLLHPDATLCRCLGTLNGRICELPGGPPSIQRGAPSSLLSYELPPS